MNLLVQVHDCYLKRIKNYKIKWCMQSWLKYIRKFEKCWIAKKKTRRNNEKNVSNSIKNNKNWIIIWRFKK